MTHESGLKTGILPINTDDQKCLAVKFMSTNHNAPTKLLNENMYSTTTKTCVQEFVSAEFIRSSPTFVAEFMEWNRVREGCAQNEITARLLCILNSLKVHNCEYAPIHARATL
jgi:hypothetical protein